MDQLILHETTRSQVQHFITRPMHAVLLTGPDGIGKATVAEHIIGALLELKTDKLDSYQHFRRVIPEGASISIDAVRNLQRFLQLKTAGTQPFRRAVLIEHAQALTTEAQNAYLKLLEEPPADTLLVLTASSPHALLPTILSRTQVITIHAPSPEQLLTLSTSFPKDETTLRQALFLSGGLPGLLTALLGDDEAHPLFASAVTAKEILQKQPFERLCLVDSLSKQKEIAYSVLEALERMAQAGLSGAANKQDEARVGQWHRVRKQVLTARETLMQSANAKLTLSNLFLHL